MRLVSCHRGEIQVVSSEEVTSDRRGTFASGLEAVDQILPGGGFAWGAIHELLAEPGEGLPLFVATLVARAAVRTRGGVVVWSDPQGQLYPPAVRAAGIPLEQWLGLRPQTPADELWATAECLRCPGVRATVANFGRLTRIEARRLQLAAEAGSGVGILLRPGGPASAEYAAATRWRVRRMPGERTLQRWKLQLIHGHGGQVGRDVILEAGGETDHVRAFAAVGDRSISPANADDAAMRKRA